MRILLLLPTLVGSLSVGVQVPVSAVSRSRAGALRCCAGQTAAASLRSFWDQVVTATESPGVRESQLQPEKQHELLAEYLNSCAELCISDGCSVRVELLSPPTINLRVDASAASKGATTALLGESLPSRTEEEQLLGTESLEKLLDWFTAQLITIGAEEGNDDEEEEEPENSKFVMLGRALLHTKASRSCFAPSLYAMHRDLWELVAESTFLEDGSGGGVLFVTPNFTNFEAFDDFQLLLSTGLRHLVSKELTVTAYHPLHPSPSKRAPVPALHLFLDSKELFVEGSGDLTSLGF